MNEHYRCGDHEALLAFVYGEDDAVVRAQVSEHAASCDACAAEIEALRSTRGVLAAWTPPETALGFQMTRAFEVAPAPVLRPQAWWRQPLPAWAQAAAAVLIFAAGLAIGERQPVGGTGLQEAQVVESGAAVTLAPAVAPQPAVTREELAVLEERLRAVESAPGRVTRVAAPAPIDERVLLDRVAAMIEASEQRQRAQNVRLAQAVDDVASHFELTRRADLERVERQLGQISTPTEQVLRQYGDAINMLVSYPRGSAR